MKQKGRGRQELAGVIEQVLNVFQQINKVQNPTKVQLFDLVKLFNRSPEQFKEGWEVAYLKIFKIFHEKANRKMPPKFQKLALDFFLEIIPTEEPIAFALYDYFVEFLSDAIFSSLIGIRITSARMLFQLLKSHSNINTQTKTKVLRAVYFLIRFNVSTYKQIGIKLASIALGWQGEIRDKVETELFRILALEENEQIRKMTITNIWINNSNLDNVLKRLRDKNVEIRNTILKKLIGEKFKLEETNLAQRYKLLYDGYGSKESSVQQDTVKFFLLFFNQPEFIHSYAEFVELFQPGTLLAYPHLYTLFDLLISALIEESSVDQLSEFVRKFTRHLRQLGRGGQMNTQIWELIWLKNIGKSNISQLRALFDENVPSGTELSKVLSVLVHRKDTFSIYECLQLIALQKGADQVGKNKMFDSLKKMVMELDYWSVQRQNGGVKNDIFPPLTDADLKQKKMLLSYFDMYPISCSFDLLFEVSKAMKALWPQHYEIEFKQLMADWSNPEENTLFKEKELAQLNVKKAQGHANNELMYALKAKLDGIEEQIQRQNAKTIIVIQAIMRLRPTASMDDYMPVIRGQLGKKDQCHGLLLLGYYCLEEAERVENFLPLYWAHVNSQEPEKLPLLISIKITTDFFVKYEMSEFTIEGGQIQQHFSYELYLNKLKEYVISADSDIRILAIEGLCRLIYHNRIPQQFLESCMMRVLMLWWETNSEEISAKSVHTVSIFIKQYIEKGQREVRKLSQWLCIFFKTILISQSSRRMINKKKIIYNLKIDEFIKRAVVISMTILKYQKQSRQIIWNYNETGDELGPQQLFLMFLFRQKQLHFCLDKALNICDFYEEAPLETLILVKKQVEVFLETSNLNHIKKAEAVIKKLQADLEQRIQIKNRQTFNEQLLNGLKQQLHQYEQLINSEATTLEQQLRAEDILVENAYDPVDDEESEMVAEEDEPDNQEIEQFSEMMHSNPESRGQSLKKSMHRITQKFQDEIQVENESEVEQSVSFKKKGRKSKGTSGRRKQMPTEELQENSQMVEQLRKQRVISGRTRSRLQV